MLKIKNKVVVTSNNGCSAWKGEERTLCGKKFYGWKYQTIDNSRPCPECCAEVDRRGGFD